MRGSSQGGGPLLCACPWTPPTASGVTVLLRTRHLAQGFPADQLARISTRIMLTGGYAPDAGAARILWPTYCALAPAAEFGSACLGDGSELAPAAVRVVHMDDIDARTPWTPRPLRILLRMEVSNQQLKEKKCVTQNRPGAPRGAAARAARPTSGQ